MTVEQITKLLGISPKYWERLENGMVIQTRAFDNYLRLVFDKPRENENIVLHDLHEPAAPPEPDPPVQSE